MSNQPGPVTLAMPVYLAWRCTACGHLIPFPGDDQSPEGWNANGELGPDPWTWREHCGGTMQTVVIRGPLQVVNEDE